MALTITGEAARIDRGYLTAVTVANYTLTRDPLNTWALVGVAVDCNAYQVSQRPLVFVAPWQDRDGRRGEWRWPVLELAVAGGRLRATLGPREGEQETGRGHVAIRAAGNGTP